MFSPRSILVALLAYLVWRLNHAFRAQLIPKDLPPLYSALGRCKIVRDDDQNPRFKFCEDGLVVAPGLAIFSCDPGRLDWNTVMGPMINPDPRGSLWALHYTAESSQKPYPLQLLNFPPGADFHPLGIEFIPDAAKLLVINHQRHNSTIEVFHLNLDNLQLVHETTLDHPAFVAPNAMAAVSPNTFFVSQDHVFTRRMPWPFKLFLPKLETLLTLPLGKVHRVEFEPTRGINRVDTVATGIAFANGVAISPDGSTLAVASTTRAEVLFFAINGSDVGNWVASARVPFSVDNIAFAGDRLLVAGHPYAPAFMALVKRRSNRAPSYVSAITPPQNQSQSWLERIAHGADVRDLFKSDGSFLTSSSTAFADLDMQTMFIVGVYGSGAVKCEYTW